MDGSAGCERRKFGTLTSAPDGGALAAESFRALDSGRASTLRLHHFIKSTIDL